MPTSNSKLSCGIYENFMLKKKIKIIKEKDFAENLWKVYLIKIKIFDQDITSSLTRISNIVQRNKYLEII